MPNCFQLFKKGSTSPEVLNEVDKAVAEFMEVPVDSVKWCYDWYNVIGFSIAMGRRLGSEELRAHVRDWTEVPEYAEKLMKILTFLEENYTSDAWVEIGRR
jgi:hypothetical protein